MNRDEATRVAGLIRKEIPPMEGRSVRVAPKEEFSCVAYLPQGSYVCVIETIKAETEWSRLTSGQVVVSEFDWTSNIKPQFVAS